MNVEFSYLFGLGLSTGAIYVVRMLYRGFSDPISDDELDAAEVELEDKPGLINLVRKEKERRNKD